MRAGGSPGSLQREDGAFPGLRTGQTWFPQGERKGCWAEIRGCGVFQPKESLGGENKHACVW